MKLRPSLRRYALPVSFEHFAAAFALRAQTARAHPLLAAVLKHEPRLAIVRHLPAVLAWHAVLFERFSDGTLTRDAANALTHGDVLDEAPARVGAAKAARWERAFAAFRAAWNAAFPLVEHLKECQENPFKAVRMDRGLPVAFSLPQYFEGQEQSAQGLCTVALANMLEATHNELLVEFLASSAADAGDARAPAWPPGSLLLCLDFWRTRGGAPRQKWRLACVLDVAGASCLVRFDGFAPRWDTWIDTDDEGHRLRALDADDDVDAYAHAGAARRPPAALGRARRQRREAYEANARATAYEYQDDSWDVTTPAARLRARAASSLS